MAPIPSLLRALLERAAQRTVAGHREREVEAALPHLRQRVQQHRVALLFLEPRRHHPQRPDERGREAFAPGSRHGRLGGLVRRFRAVRHDAHPVPPDAIVAHEHVGHRPAHGRHGIGAREFVALERALAIRVREADDVLGHHQVRHPSRPGERREVAVGRRPDVMDVHERGPQAAQAGPRLEHALPVPAGVHFGEPVHRDAAPLQGAGELVEFGGRTEPDVHGETPGREAGGEFPHDPLRPAHAGAALDEQDR